MDLVVVYLDLVVVYLDLGLPDYLNQSGKQTLNAVPKKAVIDFAEVVQNFLQHKYIALMSLYPSTIHLSSRANRFKIFIQ